jgi:hypothetical protein
MVARHDRFLRRRGTSERLARSGRLAGPVFGNDARASKRSRTLKRWPEVSTSPVTSMQAEGALLGAASLAISLSCVALARPDRWLDAIAGAAGFAAGSIMTRRKSRLVDFDALPLASAEVKPESSAALFRRIAGLVVPVWIGAVIAALLSPLAGSIVCGFTLALAIDYGRSALTVGRFERRSRERIVRLGSDRGCRQRTDPDFRRLEESSLRR